VDYSKTEKYIYISKKSYVTGSMAFKVVKKRKKKKVEK
jgi:hypothetical protein